MVRDTKVGVVTVTYNSSNVMDEFMDSMLKQTHENYIFYIIDNASADDTLSKLSKYDDSRIVVVANKDNVGVAAGNNQGIKASLENDCDHVLLINNDTVFEPELIEKLVEGLDEYQCDIIVPKIMFHDNPQMIWCAGGWFNPLRAWAGVHYGNGETDMEQYDTARKITYSPTCCMLIRKNVFDTVGYMDEKYFCYFDDTDFCFRAFKKHLRMFYTPQTKLLHKEGSLTGGVESLFSIRQSAKNKVYFIRKNLNLIEKPIWLFLYELELILRLIDRRDNFKVFNLRQQSFRAGFKI